MSFEKLILYAEFFLAFTIGFVAGRLTMAIQYAVMNPKPK
jgi:hypothetical protein